MNESLSSYFDALAMKSNRTVQLTAKDGWAPLYVEREIKNSFTVRTTMSAHDFLNKASWCTFFLYPKTNYCYCESIMKRLFRNNKKENRYRYAIIVLLLVFSASLAFSPTGLVAYTASPDEKIGKNIIDMAFSSETVREFAARHGNDINIIIEEITDGKKRLYPDIYSSFLANSTGKMYQVILDAGKNSMVIILNESIVYRIFEN